jgi:AcrR family transcriptional regulator
METVSAILEATIQVLLDRGMDGLNTVRVAERAGVSVGTLYQYYPNKHALVAAVLERHLTDIVTRVEEACRRAHGRGIHEMAAALVGTYLAAKLERKDLALALYAIPPSEGRNALVQRITQRGQLAICDMLATCNEARFTNPTIIGLIVTTALAGPVQAWFTAQPSFCTAGQMEDHLRRLVESYLRSSAHVRPAKS